MSRRNLAFAAVLSTTVASLAPLALTPAQAATKGSGTTGTKVDVPGVSPRSVHGATVNTTSTHVVRSGVTAPPVKKAVAPKTATATPAVGSAVGTRPTEFYMNSTPGDFIGNGATVDSGGVVLNSGDAHHISFTINDGGTMPGQSWGLDLSAPSGANLAVGTYTGAQRWPFNDTSPGLTVDGYYRGCNQDFGWFTITELTTDPGSGAVTHLNATFQQNCEYPGAPALVGFIRYNATTPTTVPVPTVMKPALTATEIGTKLYADASATTDSVAITNYHFDFGDGSSVDSTNPIVTHQYATSAQHTVAMTMSDAAGNYNTITQAVAPTQAVMHPSVTASEVGTTVVADASASTDNIPIANYHFEWGDGSSSDSATPVVSHPYTTSGQHTVTMTMTDQGNNQGSASIVVVPDYLSAGFTPDGALSVDAKVTATSTAGVKSYDIDWGDGKAHGTVPRMSHTYAQPGTYPVKVTMTDNAGQSIASDTVMVSTQGSEYTPAGPTRIMDTRDGTGLGGHTPKLTATGPISLKVAGVNGVPANATAVAINVTVVDTDGTGGAVGVTPDGTKLTTSNLNYAPGQIVPNMVIVPIAADGSIEFQKLGAGQTDVIADLFGYYTPTAAQGFAATDPYRALDTRNGVGWGGGKIATGKPIHVKVTGVGSVPATGVTAVAVNLTATETTGGGVIAAGPTGFTTGKTSWTSNLNYGPGQTIANMAIVPVNADGYIDLVNAGPGSASVILDVNGYFSPTATSAYLPFGPVRAVDTRRDATQRIAAQEVVGYGFGLNQNNAPDPAVTAFVTNTTVVNTGGGGFLTVFPDNNFGGYPVVPNASNLNWRPGQIVPNLTFARPGANGYVDYYNGTPQVYRDGGTDLIVDFFGVYSTF